MCTTQYSQHDEIANLKIKKQSTVVYFRPEMILTFSFSPITVVTQIKARECFFNNNMTNIIDECDVNINIMYKSSHMYCNFYMVW
jgi:hypothetical protein